MCLTTREGDRVRLIHIATTELVAAGDEGVVAFIDDLGTVHVDWDKGVALGLIPGRDRWVTLKSSAE